MNRMGMGEPVEVLLGDSITIRSRTFSKRAQSKLPVLVNVHLKVDKANGYPKGKKA